jgi:hypothetical protein
MSGCVGGCLGRTLALVLLAGIGLVAWQWGPELAAGVRGLGIGVPPGNEALEAPSEELAGEAERQLEGLLAGGIDVVTLSGPELESLLRFRFPLAWPAGVSDPSVLLRDGELLLGLNLARERLPSLPELESVLAFLPDTVPVQLRGRVLALGGGEAALLVHRIEASSIPIPRRFFSRILEGVRGAAPPDLPPEAFFLPLPAGIQSIRVEGDRLILARLPCPAGSPC